MLGVKKKEIFIIIGLSILIVTPFLNQAYYIDDFIYLGAAFQYNEEGFDSFIYGKSDQEGYLYPNYYLTHPLLWPWFLAIFIKIFSTTNEVALHLINIINIAIIGVSSLVISKRFSKNPLTTALFIIVIPAIMLLSHVMMTDIPTLAFLLLALALHLEGIERRSIWYLSFSGIAASISIGISYQAIFIILLFVFYNWQQKEKTLISYISSIIPIVFFVVWCLYTWNAIGIPHPFIAFQWGYTTVSRNIFSGFFNKTTAFINSIGAATIFPLFIIILYLIKPDFRKLLIFTFIISIAVLLRYTDEYSLVQKILFALYFTSGLFIVLRISLLFIYSLKIKDKKNIFLSVWFISFFGASLLILPMGVSRYLLPIFLPLVIVVINDINKFFEIKNFKKVIAAGLILTCIWGALCSIADYTFANVYRKFSKEIQREYAGKKIWFCGNALTIYMEKDGHKPVLYDDEKPDKGDIIIISSELWPYWVDDVMNRSTQINSIVYNSEYPVRTMNLKAHAGFHDNYGGALLPFSISRNRLEEFFIYEVID